MPKLFGLAAIAAAVLLAVAGRPVAVLAHAEYYHSEPAADAVVAASPSQVKVFFSEGVKSGSGSSLKVVNAAGQQVDNNDSKVDTTVKERNVMTVTLKPSLPAGIYTVQWKTVSADDNEADDGDFNFTVRPTGAAPV